MKRTVLALLLPLVLSLACFSPDLPAARSSPAASRWWQQAVDTALAAIATLRSATTPGLVEMPDVATKLNQRAAAVNQRASDGHIRGQDLYPEIPRGVRLAGQTATVEYLTSHHVSHILSAKNHPELAAQPTNLVFEPAKWNLARGSNDMGLLHRLRVGFHNAAASAAGARIVTLATVAKGGAIGAVVELPVSATVETLNVINERKTAQEATQDAAQTVGVAVLAGGATAGTLTVAGTFRWRWWLARRTFGFQVNASGERSTTTHAQRSRRDRWRCSAASTTKRARSMAERARLLRTCIDTSTRQ